LTAGIPETAPVEFKTITLGMVVAVTNCTEKKNNKAAMPI